MILLFQSDLVVTVQMVRFDGGACLGRIRRREESFRDSVLFFEPFCHSFSPSLSYGNLNLVIGLSAHKNWDLVSLPLRGKGDHYA